MQHNRTSCPAPPHIQRGAVPLGYLDHTQLRSLGGAAGLGARQGGQRALAHNVRGRLVLERVLVQLRHAAEERREPGVGTRCQSCRIEPAAMTQRGTFLATSPPRQTVRAGTPPNVAMSFDYPAALPPTPTLPDSKHPPQVVVHHHGLQANVAHLMEHLCATTRRLVRDACCQAAHDGMQGARAGAACVLLARRAARRQLMPVP